MSLVDPCALWPLHASSCPKCLRFGEQPKQDTGSACVDKVTPGRQCVSSSCSHADMAWPITGSLWPYFTIKRHNKIYVQHFRVCPVLSYPWSHATLGGRQAGTTPGLWSLNPVLFTLHSKTSQPQSAPHFILLPRWKGDHYWWCFLGISYPAWVINTTV